jgi:hypothetical protein
VASSRKRINFMSHVLASLDGMSIGVGIAGTHRSGMDASELADLLLRGSKDKTRAGAIPARDFMTPAIDEAKLAVTRSLRIAAQAKTRGKDPKPALQRGAVALQEAVIRNIHDFDTPGNAPSTIARKGKDDPLVETGDFADLVFGEYSVGGKR